MTPPINIDGTQITGASIDGQTVSAITVDGTTVFSPIPASAEYFWDPAAFVTGADWSDEVEPETMTMNGDFTDATFPDGSEAVNGDGVDDFGEAASKDVLFNSMAVEFEIQTTTTDTSMVMGNFSSNSSYLYIFINEDTNFNTDNGAVSFEVAGSSRNSLNISASVGINDGNKHKVSIIIPDASNNEIEIVFDGTTVKTTPNKAQNPDLSNTAPDFNPLFWDRNVNGSPDGLNLDGKLGKIVFHDKAISGQTI